MLSFPNSFTRNKLADQELSKLLGNGLGDTLKNVGVAAIKGLSGKLSGAGNTSETITLDTIKSGIDFDSDRDYKRNTSVRMLNTTSSFVLTTSISNNKIINGRDYSQSLNTLNAQNASVYENVFKMSGRVLESINNYKYVFKYNVIPFQMEQASSKPGKTHSMSFVTMKASPALFNPWFAVPAYGFGTSKEQGEGIFPLNIPISIDGSIVNFSNYYQANSAIDSSEDPPGTMDTNPTRYSDDKPPKLSDYLPQQNKKFEDVSDCSISTLVKLSSTTEGFSSGKSPNECPLGRNTYRYIDFMYCKDLGKVSNNHLITLRRFAEPVGDNINQARSVAKKEIMVMPDKGRLISWFGTGDNKLEDICKYHYNASWKEFSSEIERIDSKEQNHEDKMFNAMANIFNANYIDHYAKGGLKASNKFINYFIGDSSGPYYGDPAYGWRDPNTIWEPKDTLRSTHKYEGKLEFSQEFTLKFSYTLRYYNGINPKAAFLDLLGNILEVTYKRGKFWGGEKYWVGPTPNKPVWKQINALTDKLEKLATGEAVETMEELMSIGDAADFMGFLSNAASDFGDFIRQGFDYIREQAPSAMDTLKELMKQKGPKAARQAMKLVFANLKNKLGRPEIYAMKSLLSGEPVGLWHLTVGNPRNPILSIGNLILTGADIQHSGPLGLDDFPTEISVTVSLKHGRPRDLAEISQMYTKGNSPIYSPLSNYDLKYYMGNTFHALPNGVFRSDENLLTPEELVHAKNT